MGKDQSPRPVTLMQRIRAFVRGPTGIEDRRIALEEAYTGIWGAKVGWLAVITLLPLFLGLKGVLALEVSPATAIYAFYHGTGLYNYAKIWQLINKHHLFAGPRGEAVVNGVWKWHRCATAPAGVAVAILLAITFLAKANWVLGPHRWKIPMPTFLHWITGAPMPPPSPCEALEKQYQILNARAGLTTASCSALDANVETLIHADECAPGEVCVVSATVNGKDPEFQSLWADIWTRIYPAANPWLVRSLDYSADVVQGKAPNKNALVLVQAPAGSGKSFLIPGLLADRKLEDATAPRHVARYTYREGVEVRQFDLSAALDKNRTDDIVFAGLAISQLRGDVGTPAKRQVLESLISETLARSSVAAIPEILVFDGMDELHPAVREVIFGLLDAYLSESALRARQVYVLSRGEGMPVTVGSNVTSYDVRREVVVFPLFESTRDVASRWNNWVLYRARKNTVGGAANTPFQDLVKILHLSPTACSSFRHLVTSAYIIEQGREWIRAEGGIASEVEIQHALFQELMKRNEGTHLRPSEMESQYFAMLEEVVVKHLRDAGDGFYRIDPYYVRVLDEATGPRAVDVLHHSGVIDIDPIDSKRYAFIPSWVPLELTRNFARKHGCRLD